MMRAKFPGYYRPTEIEFSALWKDCIFVFDANVLLNLYRYTPDTKSSLLSILRKISDRIWLPYQAAYEYHNRRIDVIHQQMSAYDEVLEIIDNSLNRLSNDLNSFVRHPSIQIHAIQKHLKDNLHTTREKLTNLRQKHPDFLLKRDPIKQTISDLFDGKVGEPTADDELAKIYKQGEERYKLKKPPGYEDHNKKGTAQYGDLVMWFQLIAKAKENKTPMVFVTDDRKEDWWLKSGGKTIGPRPELRQEISVETGIKFYMYSADPFMEFARKYLKQRVVSKAIHEVREVRKSDEKSTARIEAIGEFLGSGTSVGSIISDALLKGFNNAEKERNYASHISEGLLRELAKGAEIQHKYAPSISEGLLRELAKGAEIQHKYAPSISEGLLRELAKDTPRPDKEQQEQQDDDENIDNKED